MLKDKKLLEKRSTVLTRIFQLFYAKTPTFLSLIIPCKKLAPAQEKKRLPRSKSVPKSTFAFSLAPAPPPPKKGEQDSEEHFIITAHESLMEKETQISDGI